jgi:hypothetical protein
MGWSWPAPASRPAQALARLDELVAFSGVVRDQRRQPRIEPAVPAMRTGWGQ